MADKTIGDLTAASALGGSELLEVEQSGNSRKVAVDTALSDRKVLRFDTENQGPITGGASVTSKSLGTITTGTVTLDMADRPQQHYVNNGAHTLAPGSVVGSCLLDIENDSSAGAITLTGWTMVVGEFTTTDNDKFRCHCSVGQGGSLLTIQAMQE